MKLLVNFKGATISLIEFVCFLQQGSLNPTLENLIQGGGH